MLKCSAEATLGTYMYTLRAPSQKFHPLRSLFRIPPHTAMEAEAAPMIEHMGLTKEIPSRVSGPAPLAIYSGSFQGVQVVVACNGKDRKTGVDNVGTTGATLCTYLAVEAYKPDLVISAGTSGGFKARGGAIGTVYIGTGAINHDRRIPIPVRVLSTHATRHLLYIFAVFSCL